MSRYRVALLFVVLICCWAGVTNGQSSPIVGLGIMGDSFADEYRGTDNRANGPYASVTFNWNEQLVRYRGINQGAWGDRSEPRRTGYEYNWSRSGATTDTLVNGGQATGLAQQVRDGKVSHVWMQIGINDFAKDNFIFLIYYGLVPEATLNAKIEKMLDNINTAVETVQDAGSVKMVIVSVLDPTIAPQSASVISNEAGRKRISDAIAKLNQGIEEIATTHDIYFVDYNQVAMRLNALADENLVMNIGGALIDSNTPGNEPHHLQLEDGHAGTVLSGLLANMIFIEPFNAAYNTNIPLFTEDEIIKTAGLTPTVPTRTPPPPTDVPEASAPDAAPMLNRSTSHTFVITWERITWASDYHVQVADNRNFHAPVADRTTGDLFLTLTMPNGLYYWRVQALDGNKAGRWSSVEQITVAA